MTQVYFTRLEYLTEDGWVVGHAGINLIDPSRYVARLASRGKVGRATVIDTGEVFEGACPLCDEPGHMHGACLL